MPQLLLLRHAKAERSGKGGEADHDRRLSGRGEKEAERAGKALAERRDPIDLVLLSTSRRTRETWRGVKEKIESKPEVRQLRSLYEANGTYLEILRAEAGEAQCVLLIGHNPAIEATATSLARDSEGAGRRGMTAEFPTGALAIFRFDEDWADLGPGSAELVAFLAPGEDASG